MNGPKILLGLLAIGAPTKSLSWTKLVVQDMRDLSKHLDEWDLPDPVVDPEAWFSLITEAGDNWSTYVNRLSYVESVLDRNPGNSDVVANYRCDQCDTCFPSIRALKSHQRRLHGIRSPMRFYAYPDGICRGCQVKFSNHVRLLCHLSDPRRPKCQ